MDKITCESFELDMKSKMAAVPWEILGKILGIWALEAALENLWEILGKFSRQNGN